MSELKSVKVLITGASGLLGRAVYRYFTDEEFRNKYPLTSGDEELANIKFDCVGLCHSRVKGDLKPLDLSDFNLVKEFINELKPEVIIHCAAEKRVECVENNFEKAVLLNSGATDNLASICAEAGIFFVYISTDYVFDGTRPPYKIDDQPNPINKYGLSKLQGEQATLKSSDKHCIVRVPVLYGQTEPYKYSESAVNILVEKVKKCEPYSIDHVQTRFPTHTIDVSRFLMQLTICHFKSNNEKIRGVFHCSAPKPFTKYEMSCEMAKLFNLSTEHIRADMSAATDLKSAQMRPMNAQLDTADSFQLLNFQPIMKFEESIKDCLENFIL